MSTRKTSHSSDKSHKLSKITNTSKEESPVYFPVVQIVSCCQMVNFLRELWQLPAAITAVRNIFGLTLPASGQDDLPLVTDTTPAADISRIKILRDRVYSHVTSGSVDDPTFSSYWNDIKDTFQRIGGAHYQDVINDLKTDCMDADIEKDYQELFREWLKDEDCVTDKSYEDEMVKKARKEDDLEGSIEIYQQNSGKEGLCDLLLLILSFNLSLLCD